MDRLLLQLPQVVEISNGNHYENCFNLTIIKKLYILQILLSLYIIIIRATPYYKIAIDHSGSGY